MDFPDPSWRSSESRSSKVEFSRDWPGWGEELSVRFFIVLDFFRILLSTSLIIILGVNWHIRSFAVFLSALLVMAADGQRRSDVGAWYLH